jgi:AcrR family transcriptional regulator
MPAALRTKEEVVIRLAAAFRQHGFDGATLARLSEVTGLQRASLYHYFPGGKGEMAAAVLHLAAEWMNDLIAPLKEEERPPATRLAEFSQRVSDLYAGGQEACLLGVMTVGGSHELFGEELRTLTQSLIDSLSAVLSEAGLSRSAAVQNAEDAVIRIQGALVVSRALGGPDPFKRLVKRLPEELLSA